MSEDANKQVVLQYVEAFNRGDIDALRNLFASDALIFGVLGWGDLDKAIPIWQELQESFAINLQVEDMIAEGEVVAVRYVERGKSLKSFRGHAATGKSYEIAAMEWFIVQNNQIYRRWGARDSAAQFRQMEISMG
jgi:steroid delta-isomerase-like uncharacterized protein